MRRQNSSRRSAYKLETHIKMTKPTDSPFLGNICLLPCIWHRNWIGFHDFFRWKISSSVLRDQTKKEILRTRIFQVKYLQSEWSGRYFFIVFCELSSSAMRDGSRCIYWPGTNYLSPCSRSDIPFNHLPRYDQLAFVYTSARLRTSRQERISKTREKQAKQIERWKKSWNLSSYETKNAFN